MIRRAAAESLFGRMSAHDTARARVLLRKPRREAYAVGMFLLQTLRVALLVLGVSDLAAEAAEGGARQAGPVTIAPGGVLVVGGEKVFPIALTMPPGPDAKAPDG